MTQYFDFGRFQDKYGQKISGLVHVGANDGEELPVYLEAGIRDIVFFEPLASAFARLQETIRAFGQSANIESFQCALGSTEGQAEIHVATNKGASSSLLEPDMSPKYRKRVDFTGTETVTVKRLDQVLQADTVHNMLMLDVQGFELEVLKGGEALLQGFDFIICELNRNPLYKGSATVADIDGFLSARGFRRAETYWESRHWGDALYVHATRLPEGFQATEVDFKKKRGPLKRLLYRFLKRA